MHQPLPVRRWTNSKLTREPRERHCSLVSVQEPWLNGAVATTELLAAIAVWVGLARSPNGAESASGLASPGGARR